MSENVYERHDDEMSDDVGDLKNSTVASTAWTFGLKVSGLSPLLLAFH